jgi:hypothetical protein
MSENGQKLILQVHRKEKSSKYVLDKSYLKSFIGKSIGDSITLDLPEIGNMSYIITGASTHSGNPLYISCNSRGYNYIINTKSKKHKGKKRIHGKQISQLVGSICLKSHEANT